MPNRRTLDRVPAIGHLARRVLRSVMIAGDVGTVSRSERPSKATASHSTQHMYPRDARKNSHERVPSLIHAPLPLVREDNGELRTGADADPRELLYEAQQALNGLMHVPDRRASLRAEWPLLQQPILIFSGTSDDVRNDCPSSRMIQPSVGPRIVFGPIRRLTNLPCTECAIIQKHRLPDLVNPLNICWRGK